MPTINITNNTTFSFLASSKDKNATLNRYLKSALNFRTPLSFDRIANQPVKDVDGSAFPIDFDAAAGGNFAVEQTTFNVQLGAGASVDVLKGDRKADFLGMLKLPNDFAATALVSFGVRGSLAVQDLAAPLTALGDFSFGIAKGAKVALTSYHASAETETLGAATQNAAAALTIPHDLEDLTSLPVGSACRLDASSSLKFTASVCYSFLNDPLASIAIQKLPPISLNAQASATIEGTATHIADHTITIAKVSDGVLRLAVMLTNTDDLETSLTVSTGLTADLGSADALGLLLGQISPNSAEEMRTIQQEIPGKARELSEDIKAAIDGSLASCFQASIKTALDDDESNSRVFLYEIDLRSLDENSKTVVLTALTGDFTAMTKPGAKLAGIQEIDSALTTTSKITHSLGLHLLGILNFESTSRFLQSARVDFTTDQRHIVLSDETTEVVTNNLDSEKLRKIILKDVTLTLPASANTPESDTSIKMVFFDREASTSGSKIRQFVNTLAAIGSPDGADASAVLSGRDHSMCSLYLGLALSSALCKELFINGSGDAYDWTFYLGQVRKAQMTILAGDDTSANRLALFRVSDVEAWEQLKEAGSGQNTFEALKNIGFPDSAATELLVPDALSAVWWAEAMEGYAKALKGGQSLVNAGKQVLKDSNSGFNEPWLILASWNILGKPAVESRFTSSVLKSSSGANRTVKTQSAS